MKFTSFKNWLNELAAENVAWEQDILGNIKDQKIPLTPDTVKYIYGGNKQRVGCFHISSPDRIDNVIALVGKKNAISAFTFLIEKKLVQLKGVKTSGGIIYYLNGDLLWNFSTDTMSAPDKSGRRWISLQHFPQSFENEYLQYYNKDDDFSNPDTMEKLKKYYATIQNLIKKYAKEIRENNNTDRRQKDPTDIEESNENTYNELVINNIEIKDVLVNMAMIKSYVKDDEQKLKDLIAKLHKGAKGKVFETDKPEEIVKWVKDRNGFTDWYDFVAYERKNTM